MLPIRVAGVALAVAVTALSAGACSSNSKPAPAATSASSSPSSTSSAAAPNPPTPSAPAASKKTLQDYLHEKNITAQQLHPGDPGAPTITMTLPQGWVDAGPLAPKEAWTASKFDDPSMTNDPPTIVVLVSKLPGANADEVLQYAPGELQNLTGWQDAGTNCDAKLAGFKACQVGGMYTQDGKDRMVAQKTSAIPTQGGVLLLQVKASGAKQTIGPLMDATAAIDKSLKVTAP
ncbi:MULTISPECIES: LpqN/LpqT family lipoprotein [unclassified Mycolicibacterium]|uniref:LpqN/LpqT family lipoprotein n=2 Tax=Mycolicibacterium TaxID=1866885 RepID=UPI00139083F0|nr:MULTISPECIES: LpqN/LpqT family lipoprotein [unclassified Mycolicibacterium]